jgi:polyisoprenoid-binding protein YceI
MVLLAVPWLSYAGTACELPAPADPAKPRIVYHVDEAKSQVRFDAKAFMHDFTGTTSALRGFIRLGDLDRLTDADACVRIDAASLDTDNETRDKIMREEHLETVRFPGIDFVLKGVESANRQSSEWVFVARGTLSLHGVSREIRVPIQARQDGSLIRLTARVPLKMTDYGIRIPKFLFFTVEDQVVVSFDVTAKRIP